MNTIYSHTRFLQILLSTTALIARISCSFVALIISPIMISPRCLAQMRVMRYVNRTGLGAEESEVCEQGKTTP